MTVAALLAASRAAHGEYRRLAAEAATAHRRLAPEVARPWLQEAHDRRREAHDLDPTHADPAWAEDASRHMHESLVAFYRQQLGVERVLSPATRAGSID